MNCLHEAIVIGLAVGFGYSIIAAFAVFVLLPALDRNKKSRR